MKNLDKVKKMLVQIQEQKAKKQSSAAINEMVKQALKDQMAALDQSGLLRKGAFNTSLASPNAQGGSLEKTLLSPAGLDADVIAFQKACDDVYVVSVMTGVHPTQTQVYKDLKNNKIFKAAYATGDYSSSDWWPSVLSRDMMAMIEKELKVADLCRTITMPTNPYKIPGRTGRTKTYLVAESTDDTGTSPTTSDAGVRPGTAITFDAKKLMAYSPISEETVEDMILPILPMIKEDIAKSMAEAIEEGVLNGQTLAETIDTQAVTDGTLVAADPRRAWNGFRVHALGGSWSQDLATWTASTASKLLRQMRATMGRWGVSPDKLVWICSINGYNHFLNVDEVRTLDKYGPNATLLKGELARFDNIPIVVSEFVPEYLNASGAYTSATGNDYTCIYLLYRDGWAHGERAKYTIKQGEETKTDQKYLISRCRRDFQPLYKSGATYSDSIVCLGYGLSNSIVEA